MYVCRELLLFSQLKWVLWSLPSSPLWGGGCCCYGLPVLLARWSFPICALWCGGLCCSRLPFPPPLVWMVLWSFPSCPRGVEGCCCSGLPFLLAVWSCLLPPVVWRGSAVLGRLFFWLCGRSLLPPLGWRILLFWVAFSFWLCGRSLLPAGGVEGGLYDDPKSNCFRFKWWQRKVKRCHHAFAFVAERMPNMCQHYWKVSFLCSMTRQLIAFVSKDDEGRLNDAIVRLFSSLEGCPTRVNTIEKVF